MKYLFIKPVGYVIEFAPIPGIPTLIGQLESNGYETNFIDLNTEHINIMQKKDNIYRYNSFIKNIYKKEEKVPKPLRDVLNMLKDEYIMPDNKTFLSGKEQDISVCSKVLNHKLFFYNDDICMKYIKILTLYIQQISKIDIELMRKLFPDLENAKEFSFDIDTLIYYFNSKYNFLDKFYDSKIDEILKLKPDCIGIQIGMPFYLIPGLMLAYKLKQKTNIHINIGGSFFNDYYRVIENLPELFGLFFDSISIKESFNTVIDIMKFINKEISVNDIDNFIFLRNKKIKVNELNKEINYENLPVSSFSGYNKSLYIVPEFIIPIKSSASCYWGNCIFCHCSLNKKFKLRTVKKTIEELCYLSKKYKTRYFSFWDNALPPQYLSSLSEEIIKRKLNISYTIYARFEKGFNKKILKKLKKSGCTTIYWGLDSASPKILDYIKKGISLETVTNILKYSKQAGIFNLVYLILGHPTETIEDIIKNKEFIEKNKAYIDRICVIDSVIFLQNSVLSQNPDYYKSLITTTREQRKMYSEEIHNIINKKNGDKYFFAANKATGLLSHLYLAKYGIGIKHIIFKKLINLSKINKIIEFICNVFIKIYLSKRNL